VPAAAELRAELIALSHDLGAEHRHLAILGEGNTSAKLSDITFLVKASGSSLAAMTDEDVVECKFAPLLAMLSREDLSDHEIDEELLGARVISSARKPSVEALFHALLLRLPGVAFVGHTHSERINAILCSPRAREFSKKRMFPDEVVCCGPASVFVPYTDPGLRLAQAIDVAVHEWVERWGGVPRVILIENHGVIAIGATPHAVKAATYMADKAAGIFLGAAAAGGPIFLTEEIVRRIGSRTDEQYRQRALKL
jgi:rhamnose utilization protein RhaD (predicted bifunctional aldolase and dehydrogenase)